MWKSGERTIQLQGLKCKGLEVGTSHACWKNVKEQRERERER